MSHFEILIVVAETPEPCELCGKLVSVGEQVELHANPRGVRHTACGLRKRVASRHAANGLGANLE